LKLYKCPSNLYVNLPARRMVKCDVMYKNFPITLNQKEFEGDLIQLDLLEFDIVLGVDWLAKHGVKIDC